MKYLIVKAVCLTLLLPLAPLSAALAYSMAGDGEGYWKCLIETVKHWYD